MGLCVCTSWSRTPDRTNFSADHFQFELLKAIHTVGLVWSGMQDRLLVVGHQSYCQSVVPESLCSLWLLISAVAVAGHRLHG